MLKKYKSLRKVDEKEIIIEKSSFIGTAKAVADEEEALEFIREVKKRHYEATHNVYAYILGDDNNIQRFSDDGEPSGTAGVPVLEVLKKNDLRNVCAVVTRYFGGIKLGKGGLVRAYSKGAAAALEASEVIWRTLYKVVAVKVDYTLLGMMQNQLKLDGYALRNINYADNVVFEVYVENNQTEDFLAKVTDWCNARVETQIIDEEYLIEEC
ncbi:MAG: YigZ family protein [Clostridiales bacterium]|nr:MAG: YigZ family protein [Clostridiales bacterium]